MAGRARDLGVLLCLSVLGACTDNASAPKPAPVSTVSVTLANATVLTGGSTTATVVLRSSDGTVLTNRTVAWQSSDATKASVAGSGLMAAVTAVAAGTVTITATSEGISGSATLTINVPPLSIGNLSISPATATLLGPGATQTVTTTVDVAAGAAVTYANTSSNLAVATVTATGANPVVTAVGTGAATITVVATGSGTGFSPVVLTLAMTVTVPAVASVQLSLANSTLTVGQTTQTTTTSKDAGGTTLTGRVVSAWNSSSVSVATINQSTGLVTAVAPGATTISATIEGRVGSAPLVVCLAGFTPPAAGTPSLFVSATSGDDSNGTGSCGLPFRTISKATTIATSGTNIRVAPGTYNAALGEVFPIMLPAGVVLIGDEANKGQGTTHSKVVGGGLLPFTGQNCGTYSPTIYAGTGATIAGFELTNPNTPSGQMTLVLRTDNVVIRNNTVTGQISGGGALYICNGARNLVIAGNRIINNQAVGLGFIGGGAGSKVENNVITNNNYGIEYDSEGGDLGGGAAGSVGGNSIFCNLVNDLWTNNGFTISASNNFWDHVPLSGNDIFNGGAATIVTTGAQLAGGNCA